MAGRNDPGDAHSSIEPAGDDGMTGRDKARRTEARRVEAVLLYARPPGVTLPELLIALNDVLRPPKNPPFALALGATIELARLSDGARILDVALTPRPLSGALLSDALGARYAAMRAHDYDGACARHTATLTLSAEAPALADAVLAVHAGVVAMMSKARPEAILWVQSSTLFVPDEIPPVDGIGFPVSLVTRPEFRPASPDARGRRRISFVSALSEEWFGKPIVVEPTAVPLPEVLSVIDLFILRKIAGEDLLAGDRRFAIPGGIDVAVRHRPPAGAFRTGHIELTIRPSREGPQDVRDPSSAVPFKSVRGNTAPRPRAPGVPVWPRMRGKG